VRVPYLKSRAGTAIAVVLVAGVFGAGLAAVVAAGPAAVGPSASLGPVTKHSGCQVHGSLPDHACTPGARFTTVTAAKVCVAGYSRSVRRVSYAEKSAVYAEYGIRRHFNGHNGEVDHLVSLELGGSNDESNLWPETASGTYGSHQKDRLENELHHEVCAGSLSLGRAQQLISGDWVKAYRSRFG
jgi:hypothetical protein